MKVYANGTNYWSCTQIKREPCSKHKWVAFNREIQQLGCKTQISKFRQGFDTQRQAALFANFLNMYKGEMFVTVEKKFEARTTDDLKAFSKANEAIRRMSQYLWYYIINKRNYKLTYEEALQKCVEDCKVVNNSFGFGLMHKDVVALFDGVEVVGDFNFKQSLDDVLNCYNIVGISAVQCGAIMKILNTDLSVFNFDDARLWDAGDVTYVLDYEKALKMFWK